jgi:hypothetical protein
MYQITLPMFNLDSLHFVEILNFPFTLKDMFISSFSYVQAGFSSINWDFLCLHLEFIFSPTFLSTINTLLNSDFYSPNMERVERLERQKQERHHELIRRLEAQVAINMVDNSRRVYLSRAYPRSCSLHNHPELLTQLNMSIEAMNDNTYHVWREKTCYRSNNNPIRSCFTLVQVLKNMYPESYRI